MGSNAPALQGTQGGSDAPAPQEKLGESKAPAPQGTQGGTDAPALQEKPGESKAPVPQGTQGGTDAPGAQGGREESMEVEEPQPMTSTGTTTDQLASKGIFMVIFHISNVARWNY